MYYSDSPYHDADMWLSEGDWKEDYPFCEECGDSVTESGASYVGGIRTFFWYEFPREFCVCKNCIEKMLLPESRVQKGMKCCECGYEFDPVDDYVYKVDGSLYCDSCVYEHETCEEA